MAAEIKISIDDSGAGNGGPGGGGGGGNNGGGGGGGGGGDELTLIRLQRRYEKRLASTLEDQERTLIRVQRGAEKKLELQARQREKGEQRDEKKVATDKLKVKREEDAKELTLIRVERAAERKLEQEKQKNLREERQKQRDDEAKELTLIRVQRAADAKLDAQKRQKENAALALQSKRNAEGVAVGQALVVARNNAGRDGAFQSAGGAIGSILGARAGPAGAVAGQMAGEKIGARLDDPLKELTGAMKKAQAGIELVGAVAKRAAAGDGLGALTDVSKTVADGLQDIPLVGKSASTAIRTLTMGFTTAADVMSAFNERGRQISGFDGRIASATANQDVTRLMADIREAQRFGDGYSKLIDKQTEFEETMKGLLNPLKEMALKYLPKIMDELMDLLINILEGIDQLVPGTDLLKRMADEAREARRLATVDRTTNDPLAGWLLGEPVPTSYGPQMAVPAPGPLGIPLFNTP